MRATAKILAKPETPPPRPSIFSAVLYDGTVIRVPDGQLCRCGRFRHPSDIERTGNGLRMLCGRCHDLVFEIEWQ
jgi:hypothetical protein